MRLFILTSLLLTSAFSLTKSTNSYAEMISTLRQTFQNRPEPKNIESKLQNCLADEGELVNITNSIFVPLVQSFKQNSFANRSYLNSASQTTDLSQISYSKSKSHGDIVQQAWDLNSASKVVGANMVVSSLKSYRSMFAKVADFELLPLQLLASSRSDEQLLTTAKVLARAEVRGLNAGKRRVDRFFLDIDVEKVDSKWKMQRIQVSRGETLTVTKPNFQRIAGSKLNIPVYQRLEAIRRGGFALAMSDYNKDGKVDMYVGTHDKGVLLRGDGQGEFHKVSAPNLEAITRVKTAIFADFFNTGHQDLLLVRYATEYGDNGKLDRPAEADITLFRNNGKGQFTQQKVIDKPYKAFFAMPASTADYDQDGRLDLYVGFPGVKDFTSRNNAQAPAKGVKVQGLFRNNKKGFEIQENPFGLNNSRFVSQMLLPHSALSVDFNQDGHMDILVIDDHGNLSPAYVNNGKGQFKQVNKQISFNNEGYGMGIAAGDYNNNGIVDLALTNVTFNSLERLAKSCEVNWGITAPKKHLSEPLRLFSGQGDGRFSEMPRSIGIDFPGEGLAGVEFIDYNLDGLLDLYVANGLWSGNNRNQDLGAYFYSYVDGITSALLLDEGAPTQSPLMRTLLNFQGDIFSEKSEKKFRPSLAGYQRNRLYRNLGNGEFLEVGYLEGVDSIADGYTIATADVNNDSIPDLVLRNGDPGIKELHFAPVEVFINRNREKNRFLRLSLKGKLSNRDAIGATVEIDTKRGKQKIQLLGNNGTVQSEKVLTFGLGKIDHVKSINIDWPSRNKQQFQDIKTSVLNIEEKTAN